MFEGREERCVNHSQSLVSLIRNPFALGLLNSPAESVEDSATLVARPAINGNLMTDILSINSLLYARKGLFQRVRAIIGPHYKVYLQLPSLVNAVTDFLRKWSRVRYALSYRHFNLGGETGVCTPI